MLKQTVLLLGLSGLWSCAHQGVDHPDLRHQTESLFEAQPSFEDLEDYRADIDTDQSLEEINETMEALSTQLKSMDAIDVNRIAREKRYPFHRTKLLHLLELASYQKLVADLDFNRKNKLWLIEQLDGEQPKLDYSQLQETVFAALSVARIMVRDYQHAEEESLTELIRLMARVQNQNINFYYKQYKRNYAKSDTASTTTLHLGGFYFGQGKWTQAEAFFKHAMKDKDNPLRAYAVFNLGWVYIKEAEAEKDKTKRQQSLGKAVIAFKLAHKLANESDRKSDLFNLTIESGTDLAWTMASLRTPMSEVTEFFKEEEKDGKPYLSQYLHYLAIDAARSGDYALALSSLDSLIDIKKQALDQPDYIFRKADVLLEAGKYSDISNQLVSIQSLFDPEGEWMKTYEDKTEQINYLKGKLEYMTRNLANRSYAKAEEIKKTVANPPKQSKPNDLKALTEQRTAALIAARDLYGMFVNWFPNSKYLDDLRYNQALIAFELKNFREAADLMTVIANDSKSKYRKDAAYNAVVAAYELDSLTVPEPPKDADVKNKTLALPETKTFLIEKIDSFAKQFPDAPETIGALYTAAQSYFTYGHKDKAMQRFKAIVTSAPQNPEGQASLHTVLQFYMDSQQWKELIKLCEGYLADSKIVKAGHRQILKETLNYAKAQK